jgi:hypothetical protein
MNGRRERVGSRLGARVAVGLVVSLLLGGANALETQASGAPREPADPRVLAELMEAAQASRLPERVPRTPSPLAAVPGYLVWDEHGDPVGDSANDATPGTPTAMTPELVGSVMAVPDDDPSTSDDDRSLLLFTALTTDGQPTNATDDAVVALDTNGDVIDDFVTYSPDIPFGLQPMPYETPVYRVVGTTQEATGASATWLRFADGYGVALDAWDLGLTSVRFAVQLADPESNYDWSPDDYVGALVALPQPPPAPAPVPPSSPGWVTAWPSDRSIQVYWGASVDSGSSPITAYVATATPGGATCSSNTPKYGPDWFECFIVGLENQASYSVSVVAVSADGTSAAASFGPVVPQPYVTVRVKARRSASVLFVDVDPNKGRGYWKFQVFKKVGNDLVLKGTYRTKGAKETRTLNLKKGEYVVLVLAKYGHLQTYSKPVRLRS